MFSVGNFLYYANDLSGCRVRIFDLTTEGVVWDSKMRHNDDIVSEILFREFGGCDVVSYDIYVEFDTPCLDINIEMDEEEEE